MIFLGVIVSIIWRANFSKGSWGRLMKLPGNWFSFVKNSAAIGTIIIFCVGSLIAIFPAAFAATPQSARALEPADMQNLIFVWASGTAAIQQKALQICQAENISAGSCAGISADV